MGKRTTKVGPQVTSTAGECTDSKDSYSHYRQSLNMKEDKRQRKQ